MKSSTRQKSKGDCKKKKKKKIYYHCPNLIPNVARDVTCRFGSRVSIKHTHSKHVVFSAQVDHNLHRKTTNTTNTTYGGRGAVGALKHRPSSPTPTRDQGLKAAFIINFERIARLTPQGQLFKSRNEIFDEGERRQLKHETRFAHEGTKLPRHVSLLCAKFARLPNHVLLPLYTHM